MPYMNYVYIAASIDGYIATSDDGVDWLHEEPNPDNDDYGYTEFIKTIDALVMGRNTFEKVLTFGEWPYQKKVFVLSTLLTQIPEGLEGKVEILSGSLSDVLSEIEDQGFRNLYIDGGKLIQSFLSEDRIDELIVTRIPVLLGSGIPLFGKLGTPLKFKHIDTVVHSNALVQSRYARQV
jgi:dihydrofolate reductase